MLYELKMPDLATTGSVVKLLRWLVRPGDTVARGQPILEVETDKAAMEVESTASGKLVRIAAQEGTEADTGTLLAVIETAGEPEQAASPVVKKEGSAPLPPTPSKGPVAAGGLFARNRRTADRPEKSAVPEIAPLSLARRTAARRLQQSKQTIPHFYLQTSFNAHTVARAREHAGPAKPVWDAYFVKAVSRVLPRFPQLACRFENEQLVPQGTSTVGVAVDIDDDLFVVPVETPDAREVGDISKGIREQVEALRAGRLEARRSAPGVFTISNLGSLDVEAFAAIINPPESAILAVGKVRPVVAAVEGRMEIQSRATLTLSVDHRIANGKHAAQFLSAIVEELEKS